MRSELLLIIVASGFPGNTLHGRNNACIEFFPSVGNHFEVVFYLRVLGHSSGQIVSGRVVFLHSRCGRPFAHVYRSGSKVLKIWNRVVPRFFSERIFSSFP